MQNQNQLWNKHHSEGNVRKYSLESTEFVKTVLNVVDRNSKILELGCGAGNDSFAFAKAGHNVTATDFSDVAIQQNSEIYKDTKNLFFEVLDLSSDFDLPDNSFDVVYARLSLHYFIDSVTRNIFDEIHRVLKPNGKVCFMCKSVDDSIYGVGDEIEKDMFDRDGHVRHFFSEVYVEDLLKDKFKIETMKSYTDLLYNRESSFIQVIAESIK